MSISLAEARGIFTKSVIDVYNEQVPASTFLQSFFTVTTTPSLYVSTEVKRGTRKIAADVQRGTGTNMNKKKISSEKIYQPPKYDEGTNLNSEDSYDRTLGQTQEISARELGQFAQKIGEDMVDLREKIVRAKELQCAQVFDNGIVILKNGDNIDYKRKAASIPDLSVSGPWSTTTTDVEQQLVDGSQFIRNEGKSNAKEFNLKMGTTAWVALKKTDYFKDVAKYQQVMLIDVNMPQADSRGASYVGRINAGPYIYNVWVYDDIYENESGADTLYWDEKKICMTPVQGNRFIMAHGAVEATFRKVMGDSVQDIVRNMEGEYVMNDYVDFKNKNHTFEIASCPLAVPVTVDRIWTAKVLV